MYLPVIFFLVATVGAAAPRCTWSCDDPVGECKAVFPPPRCKMRGCDDLNCNKYLMVREISNELDPGGCPAGEVRARLPESGPCSPANGCYFECEPLDSGWWECAEPPPQRCEYNCENTSCKALKILLSSKTSEKDEVFIFVIATIVTVLAILTLFGLVCFK